MTTTLPPAGYICKGCNLQVTDVKVRERVKDEDIVNYIHYIARICGENHRIRSPYCTTKTLDILVPTTKAGIGRPGESLTEEDKKQLNVKPLSKPKGDR